MIDADPRTFVVVLEVRRRESAGGVKGRVHCELGEGGERGSVGGR